MLTANHLGLSPILTGAANSAGGVMGKMVAAQSLVIGCAVTKQEDREGALFNAILKRSLGLLALVGLTVLAMPTCSQRQSRVTDVAGNRHAGSFHP